jgi:creatinine amidohydrolase/Fe(II)-dependent formamide hydrolase-like protein
MDQHGPHLPLGANVLIAEAVAAAVSARLSILRAPTFSYGVSLGGGPFAGATGLRRKTLHRAINELLAQWEDDGFADFVIITAHRFEPHLEALLMALTATASNSVYDLYQIDVADVLESNPEFEHGGELETSLLLHLAPDLVRMEEAEDYLPTEKTLRRYTRGRVPTPPAKSRGVVGYPLLATAEKGRIVFDRYVDSIAAALEDD